MNITDDEKKISSITVKRLEDVRAIECIKLYKVIKKEKKP